MAVSLGRGLVTLDGGRGVCPVGSWAALDGVLCGMWVGQQWPVCVCVCVCVCVKERECVCEYGMNVQPWQCHTYIFGILTSRTRPFPQTIYSHVQLTRILTRLPFISPPSSYIVPHRTPYPPRLVPVVLSLLSGSPVRRRRAPDLALAQMRGGEGSVEAEPDRQMPQGGAVV